MAFTFSAPVHTTIEKSFPSAENPKAPRRCSASIMLHNLFYFSKACRVSHALLREETHCQGAGTTSIKLCCLLCLNVNANTATLSVTVVYSTLDGLILGGACRLTQIFINMPFASYHGGCFKVRRLFFCFICIFCVAFHKLP